MSLLAGELLRNIGDVVEGSSVLLYQQRLGSQVGGGIRLFEEITLHPTSA